VKFAITPHAGSGAPPDALDRLWDRLPARSEEAKFKRTARDIQATLLQDEPVATESDVREELGRRTLLGILEEVCEGSPGLRFDWYAVAASRY